MVSNNFINKHMKRIFLTILFVIYFCTVNGQEQISLSFKVKENHIIVESHTKYGVLNFILDTGSSISLIDSLIAHKFNLPFINKINMFTIGGNITGYYTEFQIYPSINRWVISDTRALSQEHDYPIHGILGINNLVTNNIIEFDFEKRRVFIHSKDSLKIIPAGTKILGLVASNNKTDNGLSKCFPIYPAINFPVIINDSTTKKINFIIDTGSKYAVALIINDSLLINEIALIKDIYVTSSSERRKISYCKTSLISDLNINNIYTPIFYDPFNSDKVSGLIGVPLLKSYKRVIINWPDKKILFVPY